MHLPSKMKSTAAMLLAAIPLATASLSASTLRCMRSASLESSCGSSDRLANCILVLPSGTTQTNVESCFLLAGCTAEEASASAMELVAHCNTPDPSLTLPLRNNELRKRQRTGGNNDSNDNTDIADPTDEVNVDPTDESTDVAVTDEPTPDRNSPTKDAAPKTNTPANTPAATPTQITAGATSESPAPTATGGIPLSGPIPPGLCTTDTTTSFNTCTKDKANNEITCFDTVVPKSTCRPGLLCRMDSGGVTQCMRKQTKLTTGGIIVALSFGAAIVVAVALMTFFCCREKSQQKKLKAKMEAAAIAKASGAGKRRNVSDRVPLMAGQEGPQTGGAGYGDAPPPGPAQPNPFQDPSRF